MINMTSIGKFEMLTIIRAFDESLIRLYGMNMRDASITRQEALNAYGEVDCAEKAAVLCGERRGLQPLAA